MRLGKSFAHLLSPPSVTWKPTTRPLDLDYRAYILNSLRGLMALLVLLGHARWLLWEPTLGTNAWSDAHALWDSLLTVITRPFVLGHQAVIVFFLLSGYWIHLSVSRRGQAYESPGQVGRFYLRRLKRLYPTYIVALLLTKYLDHISAMQNPRMWQTQIPEVLNAIPQNGWAQLVTCLSFYDFHGRIPVMGTNFPLYTLAQEIGCYLLYPWVIYFFYRRLRFGALAAAAALAVLADLASIKWLGMRLPVSELAAMLPIWVAGAHLAEIQHDEHARKVPPHLVAIALTVVAAVLARVMLCKIAIPLVEDFTFAAACYLLLRRGLFQYPVTLPFWLARSLAPLNGVGHISYSLYVLHFPVLIALKCIFPKSASLFLVGLLVSILVALMNYALVERWGLSRRWNKART